MSDSGANVEIEDVLSSIRRLVTADARPKTKPREKPAETAKKQQAADRLILTPSQRVVEDDTASEPEPEFEAVSQSPEPEIIESAPEQQEAESETRVEASVSRFAELKISPASITAEEVPLPDERLGSDVDEHASTDTHDEHLPEREETPSNTDDIVFKAPQTRALEDRIRELEALLERNASDDGHPSALDETRPNADFGDEGEAASADEPSHGTNTMLNDDGADAEHVSEEYDTQDDANDDEPISGLLEARARELAEDHDKPEADALGEEEQPEPAAEHSEEDAHGANCEIEMNAVHEAVADEIEPVVPDSEDHGSFEDVELNASTDEEVTDEGQTISDEETDSIVHDDDAEAADIELPPESERDLENAGEAFDLSPTDHSQQDAVSSDERESEPVFAHHNDADDRDDTRGAFFRHRAEEAAAAAAKLAVGEQLNDLLQDEAVIDEDTLRDMVADIVRQELQGALGERITRNVRKLVRREIHRALMSRDFE